MSLSVIQDEDELDAEDGYVQTEDDGLTTNQHRSIEMYDLDLSDDLDINMDGMPATKNLVKWTSDLYSDDVEISVSDDIMDRWQWNETYKEKQQNEFLSILNPSNNSFAFVAYQRWLNVKKLELENDSFTRSKLWAGWWR